MRTIFLAALLTALTATAQDFDFREVSYTPQQTTFRLLAPTDARRVKVRIYKAGTGGRPLKTVTLHRQGTGDGADGAVWSATVGGDLMGRYYTFDTGYGETPGVFARAVGINGRRGAIIDMARTAPEGWDADRRPEVKSPADLVVYELHHRDFSMARREARHPGKFLALTEPWAVGHLRRLGVNAVHLLPSFDFGSVDEALPSIPQYNWGYDPVNYNVPEGSYSTDAANPATRIREFKLMVQALHRAGISVILDVVYNHTYDIGHSNFQRTFPDYYYRRTPVGGYSNGSGCGNETASERAMMRRFMVESVKYWATEYHVDGFRFDLMGCHDVETMNAVREALTAVDPSIVVYGEGWSAGPCALPADRLGVKANVSRMPGIAAFSDELRDALRGPFDDDTKPGWLGYFMTLQTAQTTSQTTSSGEKLSKLSKLSSKQEEELSSLEESLKFGIVGAVAHPQVDLARVNYSREPWAAEPTQMMAYVSCHDDMCLTDRLRASVPGLSDEGLVRLDLLAQTAVLTSQGVPFLLSGEELLRTKQGVRNSFESPDSVNQLDWRNLRRYPQVMDYYSGLIALRRRHPAFRLGQAALVRRHLEFLDAPQGVVAFRLKDHAGGDPWRNIVVVLNARTDEPIVPLPEGTYTVVARGGRISEQGLATISGPGVAVSPQSALILHD